MIARSNSLIRFIDLHVGSCLILIFFLFKKIFLPSSNKILKKQVKKILCIKISAIGDSVLLLPHLKCLKTVYKNAKIDILCGISNYSFIDEMKCASNIYTFTGINFFTILKEIRKKGYDIAIDFGSWTTIEGIICYLSKARFKIGFRSKISKKYLLFDRCAQHSTNDHEFINFTKLSKCLGINQVSNPQIKLQSKNAIPRRNRYIVFHMWAGGSQKNKKEWPLECWISLGNYILKNTNKKIYLTGSAKDFFRNESFRGYFSNKSHKVFNKCKKTIYETLQVLKSSCGVVTIDTGLLHLAASINKKTIALHGPTHSKRWGGLSQKTYSINVFSNKKNAPLKYGFEPIAGNNIMQKISYKKVLLKLKSRSFF